jgi:hypothetical protein
MPPLFDGLTRSSGDRIAVQGAFVKNFIDGAVWIFELGLIPYAIAVVMPSWRWLLGVTFVIGGALAALWIHTWISFSAPDYRDGGAAEALGLFVGYIITTAFAAGVTIRATTLMLARKGLRLGHVVTICVAGFAIVPAIFVTPSAWNAWKMRSPAEACLNATFNINVATASFSVQATTPFNVYLGRRSNEDAYYFSLNPSLRDFCSVTDNGKQPIKATNISLPFNQYHRRNVPAICAGPVPNWAKTYCAARGSATSAQYDAIDFPLDVHVFAPDGVTMGEFGGSHSTYADSMRPSSWPNAPLFIETETMTPDQHPLTFECRENGNGYWCKTSYPWHDGANLNFSFRSGREDVAARGSRVDAETRKFLSGFTARH